MRFAGIDIPTELVQAQAEGEVVFFVGAGASAGEPTNLPLFDGLTKKVAEHCKQSYEDSPTQDPDVFLGTLVSRGFEVHRLVHDEIAQAKEPNRVHRALATLACLPGPVRLVTSNYDDFLRIALEENEPKGRVNIYAGPALPLGDDFEGVVHIHGHLDQDPRRLVVTDSDFGAAYITRHWASDFLRSLFSRFIVCFVGYSHNDHLMKYFARGMGSDAKPRYILTERKHAARLVDLGLKPIIYPNGQYQDVEEVLGRWASYAASTPLSRAHRVQRLAGERPPQDPDDEDFLVTCLDDTRLLAQVPSIANNEAWFEWLTGQEVFKRPLESSLVATSTANDLMDWFVGFVTGSDERSRLGLEFLARHPPNPAAFLSDRVARRICAASDMPQSVRQIWLVWCLHSENHPRGDSRLDLTWLDRIWQDADMLLDERHTWLLFEHLAGRWRAKWDTGWGIFPGTQRMELAVADDLPSTTFIEGMAARFDCHTPTIRDLVLSWAPHFFHAAHLRISEDSSYDRWSAYIHRMADEPSSNSMAPDGIQALTAFIVRCLEAELTASPEQALSRMRLWLGDSSSLIRRFALVVLRECEQLYPREKQCLIIDYGL